MALNMIKRADFAKMVGKSKQYISRACDNGVVGLVGKGRAAQINLDDAHTVQFITMCRENDQAKSQPPRAKTKVKAKPKVKPPTKDPLQMPELTDEDLESLDLEGIANGSFDGLKGLSKLHLDRLKAIEEILQRRQKTSQQRGELVERDLVRKVLSKLFAIHVNQFRVIDQNLSPEIAAVYANDDPTMQVKAATLINKEVYKILEQIKRLFTDWLFKMGAEGVMEEETDAQA